MAISASFAADFSNFVDACQRAETKLVSFESGAGKVEKALSRMTDSFSGRRLIQDATLMSEAIERAGGISKLTANELQSVGARASEAAAKMKALGLDVPAGIQKIADATKNVTSSGDGMLGFLGKANGLLASFGVGLSVGAAVSFGKALLSDADALVKMSDRTGIGVEGLQRLQAAGDDAGNTIEDMTGAINKLQVKMTGGDGKTFSALKALNIDIDQFKALNPDAQFIALSDAIRGVQDPAEQVRLAVELFGKSGAEVLPTLKRGFDDLKGASVGMSAETVKALDDAGDTMARWWRQGKGIAAEATVAFAHMAADGFNPTAAAISNTAREAAALDAELKKLISTAQAKSPIAGMLPAPLKVSNTTDNAAELATQERELTAEHDRLAAAAKKAAEEHQKLVEKLGQLGSVLPGLEGPITKNVEDVKKDVDAWVALRGELDKVEQHSRTAAFGLKGMTDGLDKIGLVDPSKELDSIDGALRNVGIAAEIAGRKVQDEFVGPLKALSKGGLLDGVKGSLKGLFDGLTGVDAEGKSKGITGLFSNLGKGIMDGFGQLISGGLATLIGKGVDLVVGGIKKLFGAVSEVEKQGRALEKSFQDSFGSFDKMLGKIAQVYDLTGRGAEKARQDVLRLLAAEKEGPAAVQKVIDEINKAFDEAQKKYESLKAALEKGITAGNTVIASLDPQIAQFQNLRALDDAARKAWDEAKKAGGDMTKVNADLAKTWADLRGAAEGAKGELEDMGLIAIATFASAVASGKSFADSIKTAGPGLNRLSDAFKALGIDTDNASLKALMLQSTLVKNNPALMDGIGALGDAFAAFSETGLLNVDTFQAMERTGVAMYTRIQAAVAATGGSTRDALLPMQDYLHKAEQAAKDLGIPLDDNTQELINQSKELGIWKDKGKSASEILAKSMQDVVDKLSILIDKLGGVKKGVDDIPDHKTIEVDTNIRPPNMPDIGWTPPPWWNDPGAGGPGGQSFHSGGLIAGVMHAGGMLGGMERAAARVLPFVPRAHSGLAVDERLIVAQTGEGILSRKGMATLGGVAALNALNGGNGSSSSGPSFRVEIGNVSVANGVAEQEVGEAIAQAAIVALKKRGVRLSVR